MRMYDIILKKRLNGELTLEEIKFWIEGCTSGAVPDYQSSALLMAICINGLSEQETTSLTTAMAESGEMVDLSSLGQVMVDKHSTGGVGDKTTLVLAPLAASAGVPVVKMSGRGLGHTGGTIDKLESIPGFKVDLGPEELFNQVKKIGAAVASQTANTAPADKKLYSLRDVTATVDNISLIASSIMSKKIASGAGAIVLDVKYGSGAFMKNLEEARKLACTMVQIGNNAGRKTSALITGMDQPLGYTVGNVLEVRESIETLQNKGPADLTEVCLALGSQMLVLGGVSENTGEAENKLKKMLSSGKAADKFKEMVQMQGGNANIADNPGEELPCAANMQQIYSPASGYIFKIDALLIGKTAMLLGAGRQVKEDSIDPGAGVVLYKKAGSRIQKGEPLAELHFNGPGESLEEARENMTRAVEINEHPPELSPLIMHKIL
ncbi:MAG: thymidine phosphorylase [Clostridiales bacterium]|nr:thymidine phosphorylase [Clostridiales bacterium]MCF8021209.1 thymidine phosphorylase [Clostridiales bacterium]